MRGWDNISLGEICDREEALLQTGPFGSQLHSYDYQATGVPVIPTEAIGIRRIREEGVPHVSQSTAARLSRHWLKAGDILFARRGAQATGLSALVEAKHQGWLCGTGAILLRFLTEQIDPAFISFALSSDATISWLKTHAVGAVMPNLNEGVLRRLQLSLPPLVEQRAIAGVLGALDDKIELNRRMNETLEALAQAEFEKAKARAGKMRLGKFAELALLNRETINPGAFPAEIFDHYSLPAFDEGRLPKAETGGSIKSNKFSVPDNAVMVSKLNPRIPRVWLPTVSSHHRSLSSTEFLITTPKIGITREWLYGLFTSPEFQDAFAAMVTGTSGSHQRVKPDDLLAMKVDLPPAAVLQRFTQLAAPLHKRIALNLDESRTLAALRDALLPKLLSGAVRVRRGAGR